jgi:hypothetical protein
MLLLRRARSLALAMLTLSACATFQPLSGSVREVVPRIGNREVIVTDTAGRDHRLNAVEAQGDTLVGLSIEDARPVRMTQGEIRQVRVLRADPITGFFTSSGVMLLIVGAAALVAFVAHSAGGR